MLGTRDPDALFIKPLTFAAKTDLTCNLEVFSCRWSP